MKKTKSVLLTTPYILWMVAFTLIPLGVVAYYALTDPATGEFSLTNIRELGMYLPVLGSSIWYSLVSSAICLLLGYPVAYYIAHRCHPRQKFLYMLVMLPMCMSFLLRTLAWVGLAAGYRHHQPASGPHRHRPHYADRGLRRAVILGMVYNYLPYMILPLYSAIVKIDHRLDRGGSGPGLQRRARFSAGSFCPCQHARAFSPA